ncbi:MULTISPECIES: DUF1850 domain-containing protein [Aminobacterium]|uniref:DUF1850 domain-containing protein n=1 Tax=Aminobacterium TaxID=81466 RepID=UPI00257A4E87|nr:DUF1850 domain-containing protein [Aminobacterium sp. UBA4987]
MKKYFLPTVVMSVFVFIVSFIYPFQTIRVKNKDREIVYQRVIDNGDRFTIRCIHSVEKTPVDETYEIVEGYITLVETVYSDFGAGLPHCISENQSFTREPGKFIITGYNLKIPQLEIRVGRFADHAFLFKKNIIKLEDWVEPGQPVSFQIENTNLFNVLSMFRGWRGEK